jgi:hypothetical protein
VFAIPGGWTDACGLGVSGNWFMEVTYRQVNCCGTATVGSRNPGANPSSYTVGGTPTLGGTLTLSVDLSTTGHNRGVVLGYLSRSTSTLGGGQQVLVNASDPNGEILGFPLLGQPVVYRGALPTDTALCGLTLYTQALHVTGVRPFALSNAQDLLLGN